MSEATITTEQPPFVADDTESPDRPRDPGLHAAHRTGILRGGERGRRSSQGRPPRMSATHLGTGIYQVLFDHDITGSAYIGTIGLTGSSGESPAGQIAVVGRAVRRTAFSFRRSTPRGPRPTSHSTSLLSHEPSRSSGAG